GFGADGALAGGAVHPYAADARLGAILHKYFGDLRGSHEQYGIDGRLNLLNAREGAASLKLRGVGIDGDNVVSAAAEFLEHHGAETCGIAGDAGDGNAFLGEEILDGCERGGLSCHRSSLRLADGL